MTPYRIAITGEFRRGKDTLANMIEQQLPEGTVTRLAFADALKRELAEMVYYCGGGYGGGYKSLKENEDDLLVLEHTMRQDRAINGTGWQWWGEYRRQKFGADYWVNHPVLSGQYARACDHEHHILVTDMRHHNEADWCRQHGFYLIRIEGPVRSNDVRDPNHPSERHVKDLPVHLVVQNTGGLDALRAAVETELMAKLRGFFDASVSG